MVVFGGRGATAVSTVPVDVVLHLYSGGVLHGDIKPGQVLSDGEGPARVPTSAFHSRR
jgi:hypothetical protein